MLPGSTTDGFGHARKAARYIEDRQTVEVGIEVIGSRPGDRIPLEWGTGSVTGDSTSRRGIDDATVAINFVGESPAFLEGKDCRRAAVLATAMSRNRL